MERKSLKITIITKKDVIFLSILFLFWSTIIFPMAGESGQDNTQGNLPSNEEKGMEGKMADEQKLTDQEGKHLLMVARNTIEQRLFGDNAETKVPEFDSPRFSEKRGTFVTLTINHNLRGCIGYIIPPGTLLKGVKDNAISAAFEDYRFDPLTKKEFPSIKIEISILTTPIPLEYSDADDLLKKIRKDIDGVIIRKGTRQAVYLPQVWDQLPDKRVFLTQLCLKAGMDGNEWKKGKLEVYTYQVQAFEEH